MAVFTGTTGADSFVAAAGDNRYDALSGNDTITFNFKLTDSIISFSGNQVIVDTPTSHTVLTGFQTYRFTDGTVEENDGNPLVSDLFYYSQNHDVWNAKTDADAHYASTGWHEGRNPNPFFDTSLYLSSNPDVQASGVNPLEHFHTVGWMEGRNPSLAFDVNAYFAQNPDIAAAYVDPLAHFLQHGGDDGRQPVAASAMSGPAIPAPAPANPSLNASINSLGFDPAYYLAQNPDVAAAGVDPFNHFMTVGWTEGRDPNAFFDTTGYLATYPDVAAAGVNPLVHYNDFGWKEGRNPSPGFDTTKYLAANPDVAAGNVNPLVHFLQYGIDEGRVALPDDLFDADFQPGNNNVVEHPANGSSAGIVATWGGWAEVVYSIIGDTSGGAFTINPVTGLITIANGTLLEFDDATSHTVTVRATDGALTHTQVFTIGVVEGASILAPTDSNGAPNAVAENAAIGTVVGVTALAIDGDASDTVTYFLVDGSNNSVATFNGFAINPNTGVITVAAPHDAESGSSINITVRAHSSDGSTAQSPFTINITDVDEFNVTPVIDVNGAANSVAENAALGTVVGVTAFAFDADATTNGITYSLDDSAGGRFAIDGTTGVVTTAAGFNFENAVSHQITVRATSQDGSSSTQNFVVNVTDVDEFNVGLINDTNVVLDTVAESAGLGTQVGITAFASDADGTNNGITYSLTDDAGGRFEIDPVTGIVTVAGALDYETASSHVITVRADSQDGSFSTRDFSVAVSNDNDTAPVANTDANTAVEDVVNTVTGNVLTNDTDADGSALSVTTPGTFDGIYGQLTLAANGSYTYTLWTDVLGATPAQLLAVQQLAAGTTQPDTFNYSITDGSSPDSSTLTIAVHGTNDAPTIAAGQVFAIAEDTAVAGVVGTVATGDVDAGATRTFEIVGGNEHGHFAINALGQITIASPLDFEDSQTFTLTIAVEDEHGAVSGQFVTINVTDVDDTAPTIGTTSFDAAENQTAVAVLGSTDPDSAPASRTYTLVAGAGDEDNGQFTLLPDGTLTFTTAPDFEAPADDDSNGIYSLRVAVDDGAGNVNEQVLTVTVTDVNEAPAGADATVTTAEDVAYVLKTTDFGFTDPDAGDALGVVKITALPVAGTLTLNAAPVVLNDEIDVADIAAGLLVFTPAANANGLGYATIGFQVGDGTLFDATPNTLTIDVTAENDTPVANNDLTFTTLEDTPLPLNLLTNDTDVEDGTPAEIASINGVPVTGLPFAIGVAGGSLFIDVLGAVTFTPNLNSTVDSAFTYTVKDSAGAESAPATVTIDVTPDNDAPDATPDSVTTNEDNSVTFDVRANDTDVDNASLVVTEIDGIAFTSFNPVVLGDGATVFRNPSGTLTYTPVANATGPKTFTYTLSDGVATDTALVTVNVTAVNDAPVAFADIGTAPTSLPGFSTNEDTPVTFNVLANDTDVEDGAPVAVARVNGTVLATVGQTVPVVGGSVMWNGGGSLTFTPNGNSTVDGFFTYTAKDSAGLESGQTTVVVDVIPQNDAPDAVDNGSPATRVAVVEDTPTSINVLANDNDVDGPGPLIVTHIDGILIPGSNTVVLSHGTVFRNPGNQVLTYTPNANATGPQQFTYTISDQAPGTPLTDTATVFLNVTPVNDAPVNAGPAAVSATEDTTFLFDGGNTITVDDVDSNVTVTLSVDHGVLNATGASGNGTNTLTIGPASPAAVNAILATLSYTGDLNFNGNDTLTMVTSDGSASDTDTVAISVAAANDDPVAGDDLAYTTPEDTALVLAVLGNDTDVDGPLPLSIATIDGDAVNVGDDVTVTGGSVHVNADGTLTFTPAADSTVDGAFTYTAKDGSGAESAPANVTVDVTPVNDAPIAVFDPVAAVEDTPVNFDVRTNDTDIDGAFPLSVTHINGTPISVGSPVALPDGAQVALLGDGTLTYTPALNVNGSRGFNYTVSDGTASSVGNVTVNIAPQNDAPDAVNNGSGIAPVSVIEDTPTSINVLANDNDVDGPGPLIITHIDGILIPGSNTVVLSHGTVFRNPGNQVLTYTPNLNATGPQQFTYTISDQAPGTPLTDTATVFLNVTPVNDAPVTQVDSFSVAENDPSLVGNVLANDSDVDGPSLEVTSFTVLAGGSGTAAAGGSIVLASGATLSVSTTGVVTLTKGTSYDYLTDGDSAQIVFGYEVSDNGAPAQTGGDGAVITVTGVNEAPTLTLGSVADLFETASSSPVGVAIADQVASLVTDEEDQIQSIEVTLSGGDQLGGDYGFNPDTAGTGEHIRLDALGEFALTLFGGTASYDDATGKLTVTFASPVTAAQSNQVLRHVEYVNRIGDFSLDIATDHTRTVQVTVFDEDGASATSLTREINLNADVVDQAGQDGTFVGGDLADTIDGNDGDDTITGGAGNDALIGGTNGAAGDTVDYAKETNIGEVGTPIGTNGVAVNLSGSAYDLDGLDPIFSNPADDPTVAANSALDTYGDTDTLNGIENVVGTSSDDAIIDAATVSNVYAGGEGAESAGDVVVFRATLGPDIGNPGAPYFRVQPTGVDGDDFTVEYFDPDLGPGGTVLNTDTLTDIENLVFDNGTLDAENPVWVIEDGFLIGTFTSVADAVALANLATGVTTVEIGHGTTPPADYTEGAITISRAMTITGYGGPQTINSSNGVDLFVVSGAIAAGTVTFADLNLVDGAGTDYGIRMGGSHAAGVIATADLVLNNVDVGGFDQTGLYVNGGGTGRDVTITDSAFTGNGGNGSSGGTGDILFFEFTGNASLTDVDVTGTTGTAAGSADHGIQFAGFRDSDDAITNPIGTVAFDNVTVTGSYEKTLVFIHAYNNLSGLGFTATTIGDGTSATNWTGLFVDPVSTGGTFTPSGSTSSLDLSDVTFDGTYGWQTAFQLPGANLIHGAPTDDSITGSDTADAIRTFTGIDSIDAGDGDDLVIYDVLPGAQHTVDGGLGDDTQVVLGTAGSETFNVNAIPGSQLGINVVAGTGPASTVAADGTNYEVATAAVEDIVINTGNGGDAVVITGSLAGTGVSTSTITVNGGNGADTVDATLLSSDHRIVFNGGAGNDTFKSSGVDNAVTDEFDGGANTDTVDYSAVTSGGVTVNLATTIAQDTVSAGMDKLTGVENATGTNQADTLTGNGDANVLTGNGGADTFDGAGGADTLYGGATGSDDANTTIDSAEGYAAGSTIAYDNVNDVWTVTTGADVDTLRGVEKVVTADGTFWLVDKDANGGFSTIQEAIDAAAPGDTILIGDGVYAENVTIDLAITLIGKGAVTIDPASGVAVTLGGDILGGDVTIDNVDISGGTDGIFVATTANAGKLTVKNSAISGNTQHGIFLIGDDPDNDGNAPITAGITALDVIDTSFSANGTQFNLIGSGHIKLFGYSGDALFQNVSIAGAASITPQDDRPDNAIEITGYVNNGNGNPVGLGAPDIGTVVFDGVTVTGAFHKNPVAIFNFSELDGLDLDAVNALNLSGAESNWGPLFNIDGVEDAVIDASGYNIAFPANSNIHTELQAEKPNQTQVGNTITGTATHDRLMGKIGNDTLYGGDGNDELYGADKPGGSFAAEAGNDTLYGEAGNDLLAGGAGADTVDGGIGDDTVLYVAGQGPDTLIDGGGDTDTLQITGTGGNDTVAVTVVGGDIATLDGGTVQNVENATLDLGAGSGDTLSYAAMSAGVTVDLSTGSATGFSSPIAGVENVTGGSGGDSLTGNGDANTLTGNGGDDTLHGGAGDDALHGGTETLADTATYDDDLANYTLTVTTDGNGFVTSIDGVDETGGPGATDEGTDTLTGIEVVDFDDVTLDLNDAVQLFDSGNALIGTFDDLKSAVDFANADAGSDFTIRIAAGDVDVGGAQVVINKDITIDGAGLASTRLMADFDTGTSSVGDVRGMIVVATGSTLTLSDLTIDGENQLVWQAIRVNGDADIDRVRFEDIAYQPGGIGSPYAGTGVTAREGSVVTIDDSEFANMGRIGAHFFGATGSVTNSQFTGKGAVDALDYAVEAGAGAVISVTGNTVTGNLGVASDSSTSAGFLVTDFFGPGTQATFTGNTVTNSTAGVAAGFLDTDASNLIFGLGNTFFSGVGTGVQVVGNVTASGTTNVDGTFDWYGGPGANAPSGSFRDDTLRGGGNSDTINGFGGDDLIIYNAGDGSDTVDGGTNTVIGDTLEINGTASPETFDITGGSPSPAQIDIDIDGSQAIDATNIEEIVVNTGAGPDTVNISGSFGGTTLFTTTITVNGDAGNDTVDASGLTSNHGIDFNGGAGDDTFVSSNAGGDDTFTGGADTDTADYSALTGGGVNVNLATETASDNGGTGVGSDTLDEVENVIGSNQDDIFVGSDDANVFIGNGGADQVTGGLGNDTLDYAAETGSGPVIINLSNAAFGAVGVGQAQDSSGAIDTISGFETFTAELGTVGDTIVLTGDFDDWTVSFNGTTDQWTATKGPESYTFKGFETLEFTSGDTVHLVDDAASSSAYASIASAIATASAGDIVLLAAGVYTGNLTVNKAVQIVGETNYGNPGTALLRGAESDIRGQVTVTAAAGPEQVVFDGVRIYNTSDNMTKFDGIRVNTAVDVAIRNSVFYSPVANGADGPIDDRGIYLTTGAIGDIVIEDNLFTGDSHFAFSTASWTRGIWSDGRANSVLADGNKFEWVRTGINADDYQNSFVISNNIFENSGSGISIGEAPGLPTVSGPITGITGNTFTAVGSDFNLGGVANPFSLDLTATNNTSPDTVIVLGGGAGDTISGSAGVDDLRGNNGDDTLHGGGGNDALTGGGQATKDTATYDDASSNYTVGATLDVNGFATAFTSVNETAVAKGAVDEALDTLTGIERLSFQSGAKIFDLAQPIQLFRGGALIGTFSTIMSAVGAADAGDTVLINGAIQSTFNENVTLSEGITLKGIGSVTINGSVTVDGGAGDDLTIDNVDVNGTGNIAIQVAETSLYDTITFKNGNVTGGNYHGLLLGDGNEIGSTTGVGALVLENAVFSGNVVTGSGGAGDGAITIYRYNGDVTLTNVDVIGSGGFIENGIQIRGAATLAASGIITLEDVDVTGAFARTGVAVRDYLTTDVVLTGADPALFINVTGGGAYAGLHADNLGGDVDLSAADKIQVTNTSGAAQPRDIQVDGLGDDQTITGDTSNDWLIGNGGEDTLEGGDGTDLLIGGADNDQIDGGEGSDTVIEFAGDGADIIDDTGTAGVDTVAIFGSDTAPTAVPANTGVANDTVSVILTGGVIDTLDGGSLDGIEVVAANLGGGTDTLDYTGSPGAVTVNLGANTASGFNGGAFFIENVIGGSAADSLTGSAGINVLSGGDDADTMTGGLGNDTLYGGTATSDTSLADKAIYAGNLSSYQVTFDPFAAPGPDGIDVTVTGGTDGTDTLDGVELLQFDDVTLDFNDKVFLFDNANNLMGTFDDLKSAVDFANADSGATYSIKIAAGDVDVGGQMVINKNITIEGAGEDVTVLHADVNTAGNHNDNSGALIAVNAGKTGNFSDLTIDGTGQQVAIAIRHFGTGTVDDVHFANIKHSTYLGTGISVRGSGDVDVTNSNFTNIERIGAHFRDAGVVGKFEGNTYTGKGNAVPALDYAAEAGGGASVEFTNNIVSGNSGVAGDGSTSAGFLVTDFFAPGTTATFSGNTVSASTAGVAAGFLATDASSLTFLAGNDFSGADTGVAVTGNVTAIGTSLVNGTFDWDGGAANNAPSGAGLADTLSGNDGFDTFTGFGGDDTIDGGEGGETYTGAAGEGDTATYTTLLDAGDFTLSGGGWEVDATAGGEGTDTLTGIEIVDGGAGRFLLVGEGGYATIAAALAEAASGDTILIAEGTYAGGFTINVANVTLKAVGDVLIDGAESGDGITIAANNVTLDGLRIEDFNRGIYVGTSVDDITLTNVKSNNHGPLANPELETAGLWIANGANVDGLTITGGEFNGSSYGLYFQNSNIGSPSTLTDVNITGTHFNDNTLKGIYAEKLSDATFTAIEVKNSGNRLTSGFGSGTLAGIDINLKFGTFSDITIQNSLFEDSGRFLEQHTNGRDLSGALQIKARDDLGHPQYGVDPAVLTNVTITGNTFTNTGAFATETDVGIRLGETGATNTVVGGPIGGTITISGNQFDNIDTAFTNTTVANIDLSAVLAGNTIVNGTDDNVNRSAPGTPGELGDDLIVGANATDNALRGGSGDDLLAGGGGTDTLTGNQGADALSGGAGSDTANYALETGAGPILVNLTTGGQTDVDNDSVDDAGETAQTARDTHGTEDTLSSIENVEAGSGYDDTVILDGAFTDWTLSFDSGTGQWTATGVGGPATGQSYTLDDIERVVFQSNPTASTHLVDGTSAASAYTGVQDAVDHAANGDTILLAVGFGSQEIVTVDKSVTILGAQHGVAAHSGGTLRALTDEFESRITGALWVTAAGVVIDGLMIQDGGFLTGVGDYIGVFADAPDLIVRNTIITHVDTDASTTPAQVRGLVVREGANYAGDLTVEANAFLGWTSGIYLSESYNGATAITGNLFEDNYAGLGGVEDPQPDLEVSGNIFKNNNAEQIGVGVTAANRDLGAEILANTFIDDVNTPDMADVTVYAGASGQTITGTAHDDLFLNFAGVQTFNGGLGDDTFQWNGGDGNDIVNGDGDDDTLTVTSLTDANTFTVTNSTVVVDRFFAATTETITHGTVESIELTGCASADTLVLDTGTSGTMAVHFVADADVDTVDLSNYTAGENLTVNLSTATQTVMIGATTLATMTGVENVTGGGGNDTITGSSENNVLIGGDGADIMSGQAGEDTLIGGLGADDLNGGANDDRLIGGDGADILEGSGGDDTYVYLSTSEFGDLIEGYISGTDSFEIDTSGAGFELLASLSELTEDNFTVSEVDGSGNYVSIGSDPVFVLDDNPATAASLWYDGDGDGLGAIKVADFNSTSVLAGFDHEDFFLV